VRKQNRIQQSLTCRPGKASLSAPREFDIHLCIAATHQPHHDQAFTNFFILLGAITGLGYNSLVSDERSTDWLRDCDCRSWYQAPTLGESPVRWSGSVVACKRRTRSLATKLKVQIF
jgi:hypothetical protein